MLDKYNELMTLDELMEVLYCGRNKAYHLVKNDIKAVKVGNTWRIPKAAVMEYLGYNTQRQRFTL